MHSPIIQGELDRPIAWLSASLHGLPVGELGQTISRAQFIEHVIRLAKRLPDHQYALNLCDNRYLFLVAAWAVILRQQTNLLPPNRNAATQKKLGDSYANVYSIHDGHAELDQTLPVFDISGMDWSLQNYEGELPNVCSDHLAIISFTSGSTGESKANIKTWRALEQSSAINAAHMLPDSEQYYYHLATVPGQHMWGLETSVLLPVFANACLVDARPMFPQDIIELLGRMPSPRALISTPLHLRALSGARRSNAVTPPNIDNVLCATAPLNIDLATNIEHDFSAVLREVYGCSEVGSMAVRRTAQTESWQQFKGLDFSQNDDGITTVYADYLPAPIGLEDRLNMSIDGRFTLVGRISDQVKIAGKRGSLNEVNAVLNRFDGVMDGIVIFPPQARLVPRLVAIVVLEEQVNKSQLRDHFREYLDPAFVPRPIYVVASLPREENGKLVKSKLLKLYDELAAG